MSHRLRRRYALCIVTAVDTHTHRKVGTQSFRSNGLHWPTTAGLPARTVQFELIRKLPLGSNDYLVQAAPSPRARSRGEQPGKSAVFVRSVSFNLTSR